VVEVQRLRVFSSGGSYLAAIAVVLIESLMLRARRAKALQHVDEGGQP
jgi:hypothetical protein